ncbi:hypothetical protein O3P69_007563 [Scylla paramamosain]|uniref:Uncharacterized protein n=1 Tax=Scylla paramamosain TaxID=85552 RepID=A0AAW0UYQ3_SCYPA
MRVLLLLVSLAAVGNAYNAKVPIQTLPERLDNFPGRGPSFTRPAVVGVQTLPGRVPPQTFPGASQAPRGPSNAQDNIPSPAATAGHDARGTPTVTPCAAGNTVLVAALPIQYPTKARVESTPSLQGLNSGPF